MKLHFAAIPILLLTSATTAATDMLPLVHGIYVKSGVPCKGAPNAATLSYWGGINGINDQHYIQWPSSAWHADRKIPLLWLEGAVLTAGARPLSTTYRRSGAIDRCVWPENRPSGFGTKCGRSVAAPVLAVYGILFVF